MAHTSQKAENFLKRYGQEKIQEAIGLYQSGVSMREIERRLSINRAQLSSYLTHIGVKTTVGNRHRKYYHDVNFFEKIDTEEKAYWLGFMYADGFVTNNEGHYGEKRVGITLREDEIAHLEKFKKSIKATNPIHTYPNYHSPDSPFYGDKGTCRIMLTSEKTAQDLIDKGCFLNKTLHLDFPTEEQVPNALINHFIRGYFDGDGSIPYNKKTDAYAISILGTESFITTLRQKMLFGGNIFPDKRTKYTWVYSVGGNLQVKKQLEALYEGATVFLERKYQRFLALQSKYSEKLG